IADRLLDVAHATRVPAVFFDQSEHSELAPGDPASLFGRHAFGHELVGPSVQVELQLVAELPIGLAAAEERAGAQSQSIQPAHVQISCASTTSAMAVERR